MEIVLGAIVLVFTITWTWYAAIDKFSKNT